jgi:hypothetical protein
MRAAGLFNRRKVPAKGGLDPERLEERSRGCNGIDLLWALDSRAAQIRVEEDPGIIEQAAILAQILVVGRGNAQLRHLEPRELAMYHNERPGIRVGRGTKYDRIEGRKRRSGPA